MDIDSSRPRQFEADVRMIAEYMHGVAGVKTILVLGPGGGPSHSSRSRKYSAAPVFRSVPEAQGGTPAAADRVDRARARR